ncbi:MAG TPA: gamma-glutamyltransferase, partial [Brevundimonas sp.]
MRRRTFLSTLPAGAILAGAGATAAAAPAAPPRQTTPADPFAGVGPGNRNSGVQFVSRSTVWGTHGAAATAHPRATLIGIDTLRRGGSAIDAAIAINA